MEKTDSSEINSNIDKLLNEPAIPSDIRDAELDRSAYEHLFNQGLELIKQERYPRELLLTILDEYAARFDDLPNFELNAGSISDQQNTVKEQIKSLILFGSQAVLIRDNSRLIGELKKANDNYDEILGLITHEFKNILTTMHGYNSLIKKQLQQQENQEVDDMLGGMERLTKKLFHLVDSLLKMSLSEKELLKPDKRLIDLKSDVFVPVVEEAAPLLAKKRQDVQIECREDLLLMADDELLQVVIRNLINNAARYGDRDSTIRIMAIKNKNYIEIEFENQGSPIPEAVQRRLFEKFSRARVGTIRAGTGLGLYNIKNIVESHDGVVSYLADRPGTVTFQIKIPVSPE